MPTWPNDEFPRPAYGQVWKYGSLTMMLIVNETIAGRWSVLILRDNSGPFTLRSTMDGLWANRTPISGYTLLEGNARAVEHGLRPDPGRATKW